MGFVSDGPATDFARIVFIEVDDNAANPDANIGYDTLRFPHEQNDVFEPSSLLLVVLGTVGVLARRR